MAIALETMAVKGDGCGVGCEERNARSRPLHVWGPGIDCEGNLDRCCDCEEGDEEGERGGEGEEGGVDGEAAHLDQAPSSCAESHHHHSYLDDHDESRRHHHGHHQLFSGMSMAIVGGRLQFVPQREETTWAAVEYKAQGQEIGGKANGYGAEYTRRSGNSLFELEALYDASRIRILQAAWSVWEAQQAVDIITEEAEKRRVANIMKERERQSKKTGLFSWLRGRFARGGGCARCQSARVVDEVAATVDVVDYR
ncbi:hypothetical protein CBR_g39775 [Chara braunii]|uniref:Uncharacterized protein n=1 Tax=Chara braunii TaxID=69332 RepID=A0A388LSH9_CHABU|nr:hypothetical protein CBR_g39775 [Chara braunii]|eukprot:GBG85209.1 hypothetical protein CBR_g39775 [Chara braunii]